MAVFRLMTRRSKNSSIIFKVSYVVYAGAPSCWKYSFTISSYEAVPRNCCMISRYLTTGKVLKKIGIVNFYGTYLYHQKNCPNNPASWNSRPHSHLLGAQWNLSKEIRFFWIPPLSVLWVGITVQVEPRFVREEIPFSKFSSIVLRNQWQYSTRTG
jgi:hypothetical protein